MVKWGLKTFSLNVEVRGSNLQTCNLMNLFSLLVKLAYIPNRLGHSFLGKLRPTFLTYKLGFWPLYHVSTCHMSTWHGWKTYLFHI